MVERTVQWTADAVGGRVAAGATDASWNRIAIDSRQIAGGELFVALPGEHVDGHDYALQAAERGAAAVLVHRDLDAPEGAAVIHVDDTFASLHALTRAVRAETPKHLVGITGSAGKTTTKELIAAVLRTTFRVAKSPGNFNNLYGFPLALLGIDDDTDWMVAEMGMSTPGELRGVSLLGRPDIAVFTNVRAVHLVNFRSLRDIAEAKSELLAGLAPGGVLVANADDPEVMRIARRHVEAHPDVKLVTYGVKRDDADVRASDLAPLEGSPGGTTSGSRFRLHAPGFGVESEDLELGVHGLYNVENALAAISVGLHLGVSADEIRRALANVRAAAMRGEVHRLSSGALLVDDSYNSNPDAAEKALHSARKLPGRHYVAILGDMLELGPHEATFHRGVGEAARHLGFELNAVGPLSQNMKAARSFDDAAACAEWARDQDFGEGDVILVKASRGTGLDIVVRTLLGSNGDDEEAS